MGWIFKRLYDRIINQGRSYHHEYSIGTVSYTHLDVYKRQILYCLAKNRGKIVSRDVIINDLWDSELFVDDNTLTVNITCLLYTSRCV